jgi:hypothetical protein
MKKIIRKFLVLLIFLIPLSSVAQLPDGVTATQSFLDTLKNNLKYEDASIFDIKSIQPFARIPIRAHVIMNIKGAAGITPETIITSVTLVNFYFRNAGIEFFIDSIDYVADYNYSFITNNKLRKELLVKHNISSRINLFLADSVKMGPSLSYGFTYFPDVPDSNTIYIDKRFLTGNSLATMLGHFMGLLATHETNGGRELSSENNCRESGDYICDTYADPDLFEQVLDSCKYIGSQRDDNGNYYVPSVANLMSNSPDRCRCILTNQQYRRILFYFKKYRYSLNKIMLGTV